MPDKSASDDLVPSQNLRTSDGSVPPFRVASDAVWMSEVATPLPLPWGAQLAPLLVLLLLGVVLRKLSPRAK
jgi:hypothetical protein